MVLILLFLTLAPVFANETLFTEFNQTAGRILNSDKNLPEDQQRFKDLTVKLEDLEYKEGEVAKLSDKVDAHLKELQARAYRFVSSLGLQYVSWQQEATLKGPSGKNDLIITNRGVCAGGDAGIENNRWHFYVDGCAMYGTGGVKNDGDSNVDYQQSNLPAYGIKAGPGASMIVSPSGARVGLKLPLLYSVQELTTPSTAGYSVSGKSQFSALMSLYGRWDFDQWYFQTEFARYFAEDQSFWGLGFGRKF